MTDRTPPLFEKIAFIGIGLIGSSLARVIRRDNLVEHISVAARTQKSLDTATALGFADSTSLDVAEVVRDADVVMLCSHLGTYAEIAERMAPALKPGAIVSDVGSVKAAVIEILRPQLPDGVHLVPGHPVSGTEYSGPGGGFRGIIRWPLVHIDAAARDRRPGRGNRRPAVAGRRIHDRADGAGTS